MFSIALNPWQCEAYVIQNEEVLPDLAPFQPTLHACAIKTILTSELLKTTRKKQLWNPLKNTVHVIYGHTCGQIKVFQIRQYAQSFDTSHRLPRIDCLAGVFNEIIMCAFRVRFPKPKYSTVSSCCCSQKKKHFPHAWSPLCCFMLSMLAFAGMSAVAQVKKHIYRSQHCLQQVHQHYSVVGSDAD